MRPAGGLAAGRPAGMALYTTVESTLPVTTHTILDASPEFQSAKGVARSLQGSLAAIGMTLETS